MPGTPSQRKGFLFDVRALELAGVTGEFCGKLLAGAGADVVKVEPPDGSLTRRIGPFYEDRADPERSLHFWHYNFGKRGITLDIGKPEGREVLRKLTPHFDVILETHPPGFLDSLGVGYRDLAAVNPGLIMASITPFGQTGPRRDWKASDLVHLALGGVMMNCGYDPTPEMEYDTPPIAPQMWHSSHIVGNQTYMAVVAALLYRERSGRGQHIDAPVHQALSTNTEMDVPSWVYNRVPLWRQTARHAATRLTSPIAWITKDGRYVHCSGGLGRTSEEVIKLLSEHKAAMDLGDARPADAKPASPAASAFHIDAVARKWVSSYKFDRDLWKEGQGHELHWAPIRKPEENLTDPHWRERQTFTEVRHEDIGKTFTYAGAPWLAEKCPWREGPRAPHLGEHSSVVLAADAGLTPEQIAGLRARGVI